MAVCASGSVVKNSSGDTNKLNAMLDVPVTIPEHADGPSELKETENTAAAGSNGCQRVTSVCACFDEGCWKTGKTETYPNARSLLPTISQGKQRLEAHHCVQTSQMSRESL